MTGKARRQLGEKFDQGTEHGTFRETGPEGSPAALKVLREQGVDAWRRWLAEHAAQTAHSRAAALPELPPDPDADNFEPGFTGPDTEPDREWLPGEAEAWAADDAAGHLRAADFDGSNLRAYWTRGPGLAKWRGSPTPWRTLRKFLSKYLSGEKLDATTSAWYRIVFGKMPGKRGR